MLPEKHLFPGYTVTAFHLLGDDAYEEALLRKADSQWES